VIHFVTPRANAFGLFNYIEDHNPSLADRVRPMSYEALAACHALPAGSWVFAAFDQLTPTEIEMVRGLRTVLAEGMSQATLLNDPERVLLRAPLLEMLHATGRNEFRATHASRDLSGLRYPVFVREANEHSGSLTQPLPDRNRLMRALTRLRLKGHQLDDLLVVEFCDTADERGLYAKYSAFVVGRRVVPRSVTFSTDWVTKHGGVVLNDELIAFEYDYVDRSPHEAWLADTFALAGIQYGRIDYAMRAGRPQVWEINLNATVARGPDRKPSTPEQEWAREARRPAREIFNAKFRDAWAAIDCDAEGAVPWRIDDAMRRRIAAERRARDRRRRRITKREALLRRLAPIRMLARMLRA
jgi:hypothetical protein